MENYWSEFEYDKLKLLLNHKKAESIFKVLNGEKNCDDVPPISVELHITNNCNLNCQWCTDGILRRQNVFLVKETIFKLFEYFAKHNVGVTIEGGGEPTIHKDFEEIAKYGSKMGLHMGLISNGVIDIFEVVNCFKWVRISLDAANSEEYRMEKGYRKFDQVITNLRKIIMTRNNRDTHVGVGYVITIRNIDNIADIVRKLNNIGVDYIYMRPVEEQTAIAPTLDQLLKLKMDLLAIQPDLRIKTLLCINDRLITGNDNLPCVAHSLTCVVQANGDTALCEKRRKDPVILGNINNDGDFETIWNSEYRKEITRKLLDPASQKGCSECRITSFNRVFYDVNKIHTMNFI